MTSRSLPVDGVETDDLAGTGGLVLSAAGGLLVAWYLLASLLGQPLSYPLCNPMALVVRSWPAVLVGHLPLLAGGAAVVAGGGLAARSAERWRRPLSGVAAILGVALLARMVLAVAVCGSLAGLASRTLLVAVPVATGLALVAGGWFIFTRL